MLCEEPTDIFLWCLQSFVLEKTGSSSPPQLLCPTFPFSLLPYFSFGHLFTRLKSTALFIPQVCIILIAFLWTFPTSKLYIFCDGRGQSSHNIQDTGASWVTPLQNGTLFSIPFLKIPSVHLALTSFELIFLGILNPEIVFPSWAAMVSLEPMMLYVKLGSPFQHIPHECSFSLVELSQPLYFPDEAEVLRLPWREIVLMELSMEISKQIEADYCWPSFYYSVSLAPLTFSRTPFPGVFLPAPGAIKLISSHPEGGNCNLPWTWLSWNSSLSN